MTPGLSFAVTAVLMFAAVSATVSVVVAVARGSILARIRSAALRADVAWLFGVLPPTLALVLVFCTAAPSIPALAGLDGDHCLDHGGHGHFCPTHAPVPPVALTVVAGAIVAWTLVRSARLVIGEWRGSRRVHVLSRLGRLRRTQGIEEVWVPGSPRLCHAVGWWRPRVLVSDSLRRVVGVGELRAALAHEHAHHRRRDPLAILILRTAGVFQPPALARLAEQEFRDAAEMAADADAAHELGDGLLVASALVAITRVSIAAPGMAMGRDAVERRVHALLDAPSGEVGRSLALPVAAMTLIVLAVAPNIGVGETHHLLGLHQGVEGLLEVAIEMFGHP
ncbi:MAG: M56 family metallopeptidase [Pseudomonadota bacterium]|nr:M56 family metallopeptidase [Pseudomonadota bacterium]